MTANYVLPGQQVLEEDYDENYEPTEEEVLEYCKVLNLDPVAEKDLLYIAKEGIKAPLPKDWKPVEDATGNIYYFNFISGDSTWEHPCDEYYREQLYQERAKRMKQVSTKPGFETKKNKHITHPIGIALTGKGGVSSLGALPQSMGSPSRQLPPLGIRGTSLGGGKPLPTISDLPPLKTAPPSLAPLRVPSAMSGTGSSLGGSMNSTGGSVKFTDRGGKGGPLGGAGIDLNNVGITNKFEEEDTESEDNDLRVGFKSNFGDINLLDDADLGFKDSESSEDVSKELRRVLDMDESEDEDSDHKLEELNRPEAPHPASLQLSVPAFGLESSPQTSPRLQRPGAAKVRGMGGSKPPLQSDLDTREGLPGPPNVSSLPRTTNKPEPDALKLQTSSNQRSSAMSEEIHTLEKEHTEAIKQLKDRHAKELRDLGQAFITELESEKKSLHISNEETLSTFRKKLASEQLKEEQHLRSEKTSAVEALRKKVREEEEDEEAWLEEAKTDALRKIRQQLSQEQDKEEKRLKETTEAAIEDLRKKLQDDEVAEETKIHSSNDRELSELRDRLTIELEEKRSEMTAECGRELQSIRQQCEAEVKGKRSEIIEQQDKELVALNLELNEQHKKAIKDVRTDFEATHNLEELKLQAQQSNKQAEENMLAEFAAALEARRGELDMQSQTELDTLREQFGSELAKVKQEGGIRVKQEQDKVSTELQHSRDTLKKEHESKLQQMQTEFELSQQHCRQQQEVQTKELALLQSDCDKRREEVEQLMESVEEQARQLESQRSKLQEEELELAAEDQRLQTLCSATSQGTEQLLKHQKSELKESIEKEKRTLNSLRKSCASLEVELQQLQMQRNTLRTSLEELIDKEKSYKTQLVEVTTKLQQDKVAHKRRKHEKRVSSKKTPQAVDATTSHIRHSPQRLTTPHSSQHLTEPSLLDQAASKVDAAKPAHKWEQAKPLAVEDIEEEDSDDLITTSSSMRLQELTTPSPQATMKVAAVRNSKSEDKDSKAVLLDGATEMIPGDQEELHHKLAREQLSQERVNKKQLQKKQHGMKARRSALKHVQREWKDDMKTFRARHASEDNNLSLMKEIRTKLEQEATALGELEQRMKTSHHLLALKEKTVQNMEAAIQSETEDTSLQESDEQQSYSSPVSQGLEDIASPQTYISKLKARLAKTRRYTQPTSRKRHYTSPSAVPSRGVKLDLLSQGSSGHSSDSSSDTSTDSLDARLTLPKSTQVSQNFSPTTCRLIGGERKLITPPVLHSVGPHARSVTSSVTMGDQTASLLQINHRLGQLLDRLDQPRQPSLPLQPLHSSGGADTFAASNNRWANPVLKGVSRTEPTAQQQSHFGTLSKVVPPVSDVQSLRATDTDTTARKSTQQLMRTHTDWLKEFQQSVPLSSRLGSRNHSHARGSKMPVATAAISHPTTVPRTRLALDGNDNIQLVQTSCEK